MLSKSLRIAAYLVGLYWLTAFSFTVYRLREVNGEAGMEVVKTLSVVIILLAIYEAVRSK
jgi:hypothetical protein